MNNIKELFKKGPKVINVGLQRFTEDLKKQGVHVQGVDWRPPAGGNKKILKLLDRIKKGQGGK